MLRRALIPLTAIVISLGVVLVPTAVSASVNYGTAVEIAGALSTGSRAQTNSVSCPAAGDCVAVGWYETAANVQQAFVDVENAGLWAPAFQVGASLNDSAIATLNAVSCPSVGNCVAVGSFSNDGSSAPMVVAETHGVWQAAQQVGNNLDSGATLQGISCPSAGNCVAIGNGPTDTYSMGFAIAEVNGTWQAPQFSIANLDPEYSDTVTISCSSAGNCVDGGVFYVGNSDYVAFVQNDVNGKWGDGVVVGGKYSTPYSEIESVSCPSNGYCSATGYVTVGSESEAAVANEINGVWSPAVEVATNLSPGNSTDGLDISCAAPSDCSIAGEVAPDAGGRSQIFVDTETNGHWQSGELLGVALNPGNGALPYGIDCIAPGECVVTGYVFDKLGTFGSAYPFEDVQIDGVWGNGTLVAANLEGDDDQIGGFGEGVACSLSGYCAVGGFVSTGGNVSLAFVATDQISTGSNSTTIGGFGVNQTSLSLSAVRLVRSVVDDIIASHTTSVVVTGYTDNTGTKNYNLRLSLRRAQTVRSVLSRELVAYGDPGVVITAIGKGATGFVATNANAKGRSANRRVVVRY